MLPDECSTMLFAAARQFQLEIWLIGSGVTDQIERVTEHPSRWLSNDRPAYWIGLSASRGDLEDRFCGTRQPAMWGWLTAEVPRTQGATLYLGSIGGRSDWIDPVSSEIRENKDVLHIFRQVAAFLKQQLSHPAYLIDLHTGQKEPCKGVWYSEGAKAWLRDGGELRQEGVQFTKFTIHERE